MGCSASIMASNRKRSRSSYQRIAKSADSRKRKRSDQVDLTVASAVIGDKTKGHQEEERKRKRELCEQEFVQEAVTAHNHYRSLHGAPELKASKTLTAHAQVWANEIAEKNMMIHSNCTLSDDSQIGENIYMCWTSNGGTVPKARDAVRSWYNEILHYNFGCPEFSFKTGHFTQVVWRDTKLLGIAWARSSEGGIYVVANYAPAGNVHGAFGENVSQLISAGIEKAPLDDGNNNSIDVEEEA